MKQRIRLKLDDQSTIAATVTSAFETAIDADGRRWHYHGIGSRGHLWLLASSTRTTLGVPGHPRTSSIYAVEM